jgi:hypothetical protein
LKIIKLGVVRAEMKASESTHARYGGMHRAGRPLSGASASHVDDGHGRKAERKTRAVSLQAIIILQFPGNYSHHNKTPERLLSRHKRGCFTSNWVSDRIVQSSAPWWT